MNKQIKLNKSQSSSESQDKMQSGFFLNVVVRKSPSVFELFSSEDESLLIGGNSFLVLYFGFDVFNGVTGLHVECNCFSSESFHENLHSSSQSQNQVQSGFFLNVVVRQSSSVFQLFSSEDQSLLIRRNSFLVLDFGFHVFNGVRGFNIEGYGFSSKSFHENLHFLFIIINYLINSFYSLQNIRLSISTFIIYLIILFYTLGLL